MQLNFPITVFEATNTTAASKEEPILISIIPGLREEKKTTVQQPISI
jgi:hypothetical protein